ncbi:hypothetical protein GGX14DRAFT_329939, partial [Mycena pura]
LWMDSAAAVLTVVYHSTLFLIIHNRPESAVMSSVPAVALAYLLSLIWLGAFAVMIILARGNDEAAQINVFNLNIHFPQRDTQPIQFILTPMEFTLLGDLAIRGTVCRLR